MKKHKQCLMIMCAGLAMALTGCQSMFSQKPKADAFDFGGIPGREYLVGGGYHISYRALVEGDLFLVEEHSSRLLATISLQPGEKHEIKYDVNDDHMIANLKSLGIDPTKAAFKLYFVPR